MGNAFVEGVTSVLSGITAWFTSVFSKIGGILYTEPATTGGTGSLTVIGWIITIVVGLGVVGFVISFVMKLVSKIKAK